MIFFAEGENHEFYNPAEESQKSQEINNAVNTPKANLSRAVDTTCQNTCDHLKNAIAQQDVIISKGVQENKTYKDSIARAKAENPNAFEKALSTVKGMWDSMSKNDILEMPPDPQKEIIDDIIKEYSTIGEPIVWDPTTFSFVPDDSFGSASGEQRQMANLANTALLRMLRESKIEKVVSQNNTSGASSQSKGSSAGSLQNQTVGPMDNSSTAERGVYAPKNSQTKNTTPPSAETEISPQAENPEPENLESENSFEEMLNDPEKQFDQLITFLEGINDDTDLATYTKQYLKDSGLDKEDNPFISDENSLSIEFIDPNDYTTKTFVIEKTDEGIVAGVQFKDSQDASIKLSLPMKKFIEHMQQMKDNFLSNDKSITDIIKYNGEKKIFTV